MQAAFDSLDNILNGSDSEDSLDDDSDLEDIYENEMADLGKEIMNMQTPHVDIKIRPQMVEVIEFDESNNVLDLNIRNDFKNESIYHETDIFTEPVSTTNTMEGYLSNVSFHEKDLIVELIPSEDMVIYRCNYGIIKYENYTEPVKVRKTNRGRKKKEKVKKNRKKQGSGSDFNSQITFVTRSLLTDCVDGIVPYGTKVYKFKVFRTGKIQLPGVHQLNIDDVINCAKNIANVLNFHLHPFETNIAKITKVVNINPVMKNYKFAVKMPPSHIIDMDALRMLLSTERGNQMRSEDVEKEHPHIFMLKYNRQDTKLSIKFSTPIYKKPKKKTRINIFMRGKINVLGAFDSKTSYQICDYLHWLFTNNKNSLIVPEGNMKVGAPIPWAENIYQDSDEIAIGISDDFINWIPELPPLSEQEYDSIMEFVSDTYDEVVEKALKCLRELTG